MQYVDLGGDGVSILPKRCENCAYWEANEPGYEFGECRWNAPVVGRDDGGNWPVTHPTDWCAEWDLDERPGAKLDGEETG